MERVLVCVVNSTRGHEVGFGSMRHFVLDELKADLALAIEVDDHYDHSNPIWQAAKYRWTAPACDDMGKAYDQVQRELCQERGIEPRDWRTMLRLPGIWAGKIECAIPPRQSASSILPYFRWLLLKGLMREGIIDQYDRFVITRSDFVWLCPHPPMSILDVGTIWVPDGEHWGGLNDRHAVVSRADLVSFLNGIEDLLLEPDQLYEEMAQYRREWNSEGFVSHLLRRKGLLARTEVFPYVMYLARAVDDKSPTWSSGHYEPAAGHSVKYPEEFRLATAYATLIHTRADWEGGSWRRFDPDLYIPPPVPTLRWMAYGLSRMRIKLFQWFAKPKRISRLAGICRKIVRGILGCRLQNTGTQPSAVSYSRKRAS